MSKLLTPEELEQTLTMYGHPGIERKLRAHIQAQAEDMERMLLANDQYEDEWSAAHVEIEQLKATKLPEYYYIFTDSAGYKVRVDAREEQKRMLQASVEEIERLRIELDTSLSHPLRSVIRDMIEQRDEFARAVWEERFYDNYACQFCGNTYVGFTKEGDPIVEHESNCIVLKAKEVLGDDS